MQLNRVILAFQSTMSVVVAEMVWESLNRSSEPNVSMSYDDERFNGIGKRIKNADATIGGRTALDRSPAARWCGLARCDLCGFLDEHFGLADGGVINKPSIQ